MEVSQTIELDKIDKHNHFSHPGTDNSPKEDNNWRSIDIWKTIHF